MFLFHSLSLRFSASISSLLFSSLSSSGPFPVCFHLLLRVLLSILFCVLQILLHAVLEPNTDGFHNLQFVIASDPCLLVRSHMLSELIGSKIKQFQTFYSFSSPLRFFLHFAFSMSQAGDETDVKIQVCVSFNYSVVFLFERIKIR